MSGGLNQLLTRPRVGGRILYDRKQLAPSQENVIIYNPLNTIWRDTRGNPGLLESMYVAKIVTGGVGKFDWKYERQ